MSKNSLHLNHYVTDLKGRRWSVVSITFYMFRVELQCIGYDGDQEVRATFSVQTATDNKDWPCLPSAKLKAFITRGKG